MKAMVLKNDFLHFLSFNVIYIFCLPACVVDEEVLYYDLGIKSLNILRYIETWIYQSIISITHPSKTE